MTIDALALTASGTFAILLTVFCQVKKINLVDGQTIQFLTIACPFQLVLDSTFRRLTCSHPLQWIATKLAEVHRV